MAKEIEFKIDPFNLATDDTICATIRAIWREADKTGNDNIKELAALAFDKGKRMNRRLVKYRKRFLQLPPNLRDELNKITGEE